MMTSLGAMTSFFCAAVCCFAQPKVSNRLPAPGEVVYRPADNSVAEMNPPSLTWLRENQATEYIVQFGARKDFVDATTVSNLQFNCYTHNTTLSPGVYYWRYACADADKRASGWSQPRAFTIASESIPMPLPSKPERQKLVPQGHPRLFVRPEMLPGLRLAAEGKAKSDFEQLRKQADNLLGAILVAEPKNPGTASNKTNTMLLQNWWKNRELAVQACMEAETVAFVYLITAEQKYGLEARRRLLDLASWDPAGETNFKRNCEAGKPLLHRIARVYDWCYPALSTADKNAVYSSVTRRIQDAWISGEVGQGVGGINNPFNSHGNRTFHKIGESGIVFLGEIPEAEMWLDYALNRFYACYPAWADSDGGWHEGLSYWAGYMGKVVWWLDAIDVALNIDGFKKPFFSHVGDFALYAAPPGTPNMGLGDLSYRPPAQGWGSFLEYFNRKSSLTAAQNGDGSMKRNGSNAAYWRWWTDQWNMSSTAGVLGFLYTARLPNLPEPKAPTDLPLSKVFDGTGIASFHRTLLDSKEDVHLLFKSSPFGSLSHGFNPQNSFQLNAYGECLLPACVYRDWYGTGFHYKWVHQTISQNAVLVNGRGQVTHSAVPGRIATELHGPGWDYVCGDAGDAYGKEVTRALRHVLFLKSGAVILLDELEATAPSTFQFMLHGLSPFTVNSEAQSLALQQPGAGLQAFYLAEKPLAFKQWDGFDPKPLRGDFPNHWHVEAATVQEQTRVANITVLLPYKGKTAPTTSAKRWDEQGALAVEISVDGHKTLAAFRKADATGSVTIQGLEVEGPVSVRP